MKKSWTLGLLVCCALVRAEGADIVDRPETAALQRGARVFMNYCSGCHSLKYLRYSQMAQALGLTRFDGEVDKPLLYGNLVFTKAALHDPIRIALRSRDALAWFGAVPPDLSLIVRQRGKNWLYSYLKSFYHDASKPFGVDNLLSPGVAMPNVLEILAGEQILNSSGQLQRTRSGLISPAEFDSLLTDLVSFLSYVSEPEQAFRRHVGYAVLVFLGLLATVLYLLEREIWRTVARKK